MESPCIFLGIKVKPGPIQRFKLENYTLDNTVSHLRSEAEKKANVPSASLELVHHGKILKPDATLQDSGVKSGEMVHVVKKKQEEPAAPRVIYTDAELHSLNSALRSLGCTPNAPGWTRAMQLLNEESVMNEILEVAPSLREDCVALSILHEVELLAALGATVESMRRGAEAHPELPAALMHLMRLERVRAVAATPNDSGAAISGFAYSLEALSEEEDEEEEPEAESQPERSAPITQEQLAAALQAATDAVSGASTRGGAVAEDAAQGEGVGRQSLLQLLRGSTTPQGHRHARDNTAGQPRLLRLLGSSSAPEVHTQQSLLDLLRGSEAEARPQHARDNTAAGGERAVITPEMFSSAISEAITRASADSNQQPAPMDTAPEAGLARAVITQEALSEALTDALSRSGSARGTPMENSTRASSSQSPVPRDEDFTTQLNHMHEMGLLDDAHNVRALLVCAGDVNAAINLVFSGAIGDD